MLSAVYSIPTHTYVANMRFSNDVEWDDCNINYLLQPTCNCRFPEDIARTVTEEA